MIPKIIHQSWKTKDIPNIWKEYHKTWMEKFPTSEYKHILWTDEDNRNLIKEHYPWFLETYDGYPKNIQRADSVRYFYLFHYGGIYADLDCEVRNNFFDKLDQDKINIVQCCYQEGRMMNCLMASPQGEQKWKLVFDKMIQAKDGLKTVHTTGPWMVTKAFQHQEINILDYDNFNPLKKRPTVRGFFENMLFTRLDEQKSKNWDDADVVHHGTESWYGEEIQGYFSQLWVLIILICLIFFISYKVFKKIS